MTRLPEDSDLIGKGGEGEGVRASPASQDRATHEQSPQAVSAVPVGIADAWSFAVSIRDTLAAHPAWLPQVLVAVTEGMQGALDRLNKQRAASDAACLAALALCDTKRLSPALRASLLGTITRPMYAPNLCELERTFAAQAIDARRAETQSGSVHESAAPKGCAQ